MTGCDAGRIGTRGGCGIEALEGRLLLAGETVLHSFAGKPTDGSVPQEGLIMVGSKLFGITSNGGPNDDGSGGGAGLGHKGGTLFSVNTDGSGYQVLHTFGGTLAGGAMDGYEPLANLTAFNGKLYGTTPFGGKQDVGTVFSINEDGSGYTQVHVFGGDDPLRRFDDGAFPFSTPVVFVGNKLYGLATAGGSITGSGSTDTGVLFSMDPDGGNYTKVHVFASGPQVATYNLGMVRDGTTFWGITSGGGPANAGTIYAIGVDGSNFRILHAFDGAAEGYGPMDGMTLVNGTTLAGVTNTQGAVGQGTLFTMNTDGTNFQVKQSFATFTNGAFPHGELTQVGDKLYGTTTLGGIGFPTISPVGSVYSVNLDGTGFQTVDTFNGLVNTDPSAAYGQLVSDGSRIYGVSGGGGTSGIGTIYSIPVGGGQVGQSPTLTMTVDGAPVTNNQTGKIDFGSVARSRPMPTKVFTVKNTGGSALNMGTPVLPAGFVLAEPLATTLAPGASDTFTVALDTGRQGLFGGDVVIQSNDGGVTNNRFAFTIQGRVTVNGGGGGGGGGGSGTSDLVPSISGKVPKSAIGGSTKTTLRVKVTNSGTTTAGASTLNVVLSADETPDVTDFVLATAQVPSLRARQARTVPATFVFPSGVADGTYRVLAVADAGDAVSESNEGNNVAATTPLPVAKPFVNLSGTQARPGTARVGKPATLMVTVRNGGNIDAKAMATPMRVVLSRDGVFDGNGEETLLDATQVLTIKAGKTKNVVLRLPGIAGPAGTFAVQTLIDPGGVTVDSDATDDVITGTVRVT